MPDPIIIRCGRCGTRLRATVDELQDYVTADCEACADHRNRRLAGRIAIIAAAMPSRRHRS